MKILGLCGRRKSGKTRVADIVVKMTSGSPYPFKKISFADPLRIMFAEDRGIDPEDLKNNYTKEFHRKDIIEYSQRVKESDPLFFVTALFDFVDQHENIVIDDIRFIEEFAETKIRGGIIYRVDSSKELRKARGWEYNIDVDESLSETELGDLSAYTMSAFGGIINNNGTDEQLRKDIREILIKHFLPY